jgi:hypothetical protein
MCQRFIQERYDSALGPDRSWKYEDAVSFDISTDGIVELDIVTPLADIIDDGEDGWDVGDEAMSASKGSLGDEGGVFSFSIRGRE